MEKSGSIDLNASSRKSRISIYWNFAAIGQINEKSDYNRIDVGIDADVEGVNDNDGVLEEEIFCRWVSTRNLQEEVASQYLVASALRRLLNRRDAQLLLTVEMELKDSSIKTGELAWITTDELLDIDGTDLRAVYQLIRRDPKGNKLVMTFQKLPTNRRLAFFAPEGLPNYIDATDAQREYGFFCGTDGMLPDGSEPYCFW